MSDQFDEDEVQEIIDVISSLCDRVGWTMRAVAMDDVEGGISGIILGNEEFFDDIGLDEMSIPNIDDLH